MDAVRNAFHTRVTVPLLILSAVCAFGVSLDMTAQMDAGSGFVRFFAALPLEQLPLVLLEFVAFFALFTAARAVSHKRNCYPHAAFLGLLAAFAFLVGPTLQQVGTCWFLFHGTAQIAKTVWKSAALFCVAVPFFLMVLTGMDRIRDGRVAACVPRAASGLASGFGSETPASHAAVSSKKSLPKPLAAISDWAHQYAAAFDSHPFAVTAVTLLVVWMPYIVAVYPGIVHQDGAAQILQMHGIKDFTASYLPLMDESVLLNQHHSVLHTLLLNGCVWLGEVLFGSMDNGVYLYEIVQTSVVLVTLGFAMSVLARLGIRLWARVALLVFLCAFPFYSTYAECIAKDTMFACAVLVLFMELYLLFDDKMGWRRSDAVLAGFALFVILFFRNGMLIIVVLLLAACFLFKRDAAKHVAIVALPGIVSFLIATMLVFPALSITPSGAREMLSIPLQQVARCIVYHEDSITKEEKQAINKAIDYKQAKELYDPTVSDPIKRTFREKTITLQEKSEFFKVWFAFLKRYPATCAEATMANYYGALWFAKTPNTLGTYGLDYAVDTNKQRFGNTALSCIHPPISALNQDALYQARKAYCYAWDNAPVLSIPGYAAFWMWLLLVLCAWSFKERGAGRASLVLVLLIALLSLMGPCNPGFYLRYYAPAIFCLPFAVGFVFPGVGARFAGKVSDGEKKVERKPRRRGRAYRSAHAR